MKTVLLKNGKQTLVYDVPGNVDLLKVKGENIVASILHEGILFAGTYNLEGILLHMSAVSNEDKREISIYDISPIDIDKFKDSLTEKVETLYILETKFINNICFVKCLNEMNELKCYTRVISNLDEISSATKKTAMYGNKFPLEAFDFLA